MSNIIKKHMVMAESPKILESFILDEIENPKVIIPTQAVDVLETEKEELEKLKQESNNILSETENMVLELLEKARLEARNIISDAREEASDIRAQVYEEADTIRIQAQEEGYGKGLKKAQQEIEADRLAALEQRNLILEEARQTKLKTIKSMERDISQLVMAISKKIVAGEIVTSPQIIINIVREAINFLDNPENITVYVNPHDLENLLAGIDLHQLSEPGSKETPVEVCSTDKIKVGGCMVETDVGRVDARLEVRAASVERALLEVTNDE